MSQELTLEQAIKNIEIVCDKFFIGKKEEHVVLQKCLDMIKDELKSKDE